MKKELQDKLIERFPFLRPEWKEHFFCNDGWFSLLWEFGERIEKIKPENYKILQIKEKFGGLRLNGENESEEIKEIVREIESRSYTVCEFCGKPGKLRRPMVWIRTLCFKHYIISRIKNFIG
jgi:hypothetical protein